MNFITKYSLFILAIVGSKFATAQSIELIVTDSKSQSVKKFNSKGLMLAYLSKELDKRYNEGFLEAYYDTIKVDSIHYKAVFQNNQIYKWKKVVVHSDGGNSILRNKRSFTKNSFTKATKKIIRQKEENGYPFASASFDSIHIENGQVNGRISVNNGRFYKIDSVILKGNVKIPKIYIYRYLGIKPGMPYNEKQIKEADQRLKEIPFLMASKPTDVLFTETQSLVYLYLKKRNASSFNGIIGILPDAATGKTTITGDARVILKNAVGYAETFDLNWRKIANKTQDLKVNLTLPFLFSSPVGTDLNFKLFKRDTSFLELNRGIGLTWQLNRGNSFKLFYNRYNSDILARTFYTTGTTLNLQNADVAINQYGIGTKFEKLDYRLNPKKGISLNVDFTAGIKELKPNASNDSELYNNEILRSEYYTGNFNGEYYIPILKSFAIRFANQTRFIVNQKIYKNELLRIGGIKTLRGFDEESIFASAFSIGTIEYRFIFDENSSLFVFFDQSWYENNSTDTYVNDTPYGFGTGVNFAVKSGVFSFTWALGSQQNNPILFKNSKLHFGFINYF